MNSSSVTIPENVPILVVDDEASIAKMISRALSQIGFISYSAGNAYEALAMMVEHPFDVVITDVHMPGMSGVDLLKRIKAEYDSNVIVMTGFTKDYDYESIITAGASDFVYKPVSFKELKIRLKRVLHLRYLMIERDEINRELKENVEQLVNYSERLENAHHELRYAYLDTINRIVAATEYKDQDTGDHIVRISRYCSLIAEKLGLTAETVELIQYASPMHDIGKIAIPDHLLQKPDRLTRKEFEIVKTHTTVGAKILENARSEVLKLSHDIALTHHEKYNGHGYPRGLSCAEIPISGRIVAIADTFDALTSRRPYKAPYPIDVAADIIQSERERHFDPDVTDVFIGHLDEIGRIREEVGLMEIASLSDFIWSSRDIAEGLDKKIAPRQTSKIDF